MFTSYLNRGLLHCRRILCQLSPLTAGSWSILTLLILSCLTFLASMQFITVLGFLIHWLSMDLLTAHHQTLRQLSKSLLKVFRDTRNPVLAISSSGPGLSSESPQPAAWLSPADHGCHLGPPVSALWRFPLFPFPCRSTCLLYSTFFFLCLLLLFAETHLPVFLRRTPGRQIFFWHVACLKVLLFNLYT